MGVIDKVAEKVSSLLPTRHERQEMGHELPPVGSEVLALRDNLDRWLQRFFDEPWGLRAVGNFELIPTTNVHETDNEVVVTAEVPGLDATDLDLAISGDSLIIRGEKREEENKQDKRRGVYISERTYGSFVRTVPLPEHVDPDRAVARVERGVLAVTFPKLESRNGKRIPIAQK